MASVQKKTYNRRHVGWDARWRDPTGAQKKKTFRRRSDAERFLTSIEHARLTGTYLDPAAGRITIANWAPEWMALQTHLKPSTRARYDGIVARHLVPWWGTRRLHDITPGQVAAWVSHLTGSGLAAGTVRYTHRVLSLMLDWAVRDNRIARNPATGVALPRVTPATKRFLTHQQVNGLANAAGDYRLLILLLAYTGLRWGELAALRVSDLDLDTRRLSINRSVSEVRGKLEWGTPKSHARRSVALPPFLAEALADHIRTLHSGDPLFTTRTGTVLRNLNFRRDVFDAAAEEAGLAGLTPHELRHTAASLAIAAGANVKAVQRMLGHASASMTLDVYSGLFEDDLDTVAQGLDTARRNAGTKSRPL